MSALGTESNQRSATQCVAYIAAAEIPHAQWPELVPTLLHNVTNQTSPNNDTIKEASLETIGYICEELVSV